MNHDEFKANAETLATNQFLPAYNALRSTHFQMLGSDDVAPDACCVDVKTGERLNLEITLATRSPDGPLTWRKMLNGTYTQHGPSNLDVEGELQAYRDNILKKFSKRYGRNTALVVFQWGPVMPWNIVLERFRSMIDFAESPFDKGVWMLSWRELFRLDQDERC